MTEILKNFLLDIIGEAENILDFGMTSLSSLVFNLEKMLQEAGGSYIFNIDKVLLVTYGFGLSLLILKCLKKGFEQYILWTDGDADTPPMEMLVKIAKAIAVAAGFPILYQYLVDITNALMNRLLRAFSVDWDAITFDDIFSNTILSDARITFVKALLTFVYLILICILIYQFFKKGVEMLVLRMGVPIGVIGYLDSDQGVSKAYFKVFFQCALTVMIQTVSLKISISLWISSNNIFVILVAIVFMAFAVGTSKFLSQFLLQSGGGGGSAVSSVYFASSSLSRLTSLLKR